jgi:hypothetical protein
VLLVQLERLCLKRFLQNQGLIDHLLNETDLNLRLLAANIQELLVDLIFFLALDHYIPDCIIYL